MSKHYVRTFSWGFPLDRKVCLLVCTCDELVLDGYEDFSVVDTYVPHSLPTSDEANWWSKPYEKRLLVCATGWQINDLTLRSVLSREGQVRLYGPGGKPDHTYQIPEAGVFGNAAVGLGYVNRIRAIGDGLFVCGQSRQVYRFAWDGRNLASGRWVDMAGAMRQPPIAEPPDDADADAFDQWLDDNDAIDLVDIDGPSERDLYAVGDECWHWNGAEWRQLALPTDEFLNAIKVRSPELIYLVGHNGTLLAGNARSGFRELSAVEDNQNFIGVEWFADRLFLASNLGLFTYDPRTARIEPYRTDLKPDLRDTHVLEARDGVLWSIGFKDLAWFDGQRWTRVDHPDNPPIR